jgi:hypothetical protein
MTAPTLTDARTATAETEQSVHSAREAVRAGQYGRAVIALNGASTSLARIGSALTAALAASGTVRPVFPPAPPTAPVKPVTEPPIPATPPAVPAPVPVTPVTGVPAPQPAPDPTPAPVTPVPPVTPPAAVTTAGPPQPTWHEEFATLSVEDPPDPTSTWWANGSEGGPWNEKGHVDYAGRSWDADTQLATQLGLVSVADSILTLKALRNPGNVGIAATTEWLSAYLVRNQLQPDSTFRFGYYETRAKITFGRGFFPALWLLNGVPNRADGYEGAEIDLVEWFGAPKWNLGVHYSPSGLATDSAIKGTGVYSTSAVDSDWHRYGVNWSETEVSFYFDGRRITALDPAGVEWFSHADLQPRFDSVVDPNWDTSGAFDESTPTDPAVGFEPCLQVDYARRWETIPASLPTGSADPYPALATT